MSHTAKRPVQGPSLGPLMEVSEEEEEGLPICQIATLEGHSSSVLNMCFNQNGQYLLTCSQDKSVKLWNPMKREGQQMIKSYRGAHNYEVNDVCVTSDSSRFFTVGGDKNAYCWDVASGEVIRKFSGHDRKISACCLYDDSVFFTASHDKTVRGWDARQRDMRKPLQMMDDARDACIQVCTVGKEVIVGSVDGCIYRYDIRMGCMFTDSLGAPVGSLTLSNDQNCVLVATLNDTIRLLEKDSGEELSKYMGHKNSNFKLGSTLSPGDEYVCGGSEDGTLFFWDLVSGEKIHSIPEAHKNGAIFACKFSPATDKTLLCTSGVDGKIHVWTPGKTV